MNKFFKDLLERAAATAAEAALALVVLDGFNLVDVGDLKQVGLVAGTAALAAVLKAVAARKVGNRDDASLVK